jgi:hypothetical protein
VTFEIEAVQQLDQSRAALAELLAIVRLGSSPADGASQNISFQVAGTLLEQSHLGSSFPK